MRHFVNDFSDKFLQKSVLESGLCFVFQGCCVGQGTLSELSKSGLDVRLLISFPESDSDSAINTDDVQVEEKNGDINSTQITEVKPVVGKFFSLIIKRREPVKYFGASSDEGLSIYNVRDCAFKVICLVSWPSSFARLVNTLLSETLI